MKHVPPETNFIGMVTVRDAEVESWLSVGWDDDGPTPMGGWRRLEWRLQTQPVAPLSAVIKPASREGQIWAKFLRERAWQQVPSFLYLIREAGAEGLTKVGIADNVPARLKQHQSGNSRLLSLEEVWRLPNREAAQDLERLVVQYFAPVCMRGREWLDVPVKTVSEFIQDVLTTNNIRGVQRVPAETAFIMPPELRTAS